MLGAKDTTRKAMQLLPFGAHSLIMFCELSSVARALDDREYEIREMGFKL